MNKMSTDKYGLQIEEYLNNKDKTVYRVHRLYETGKMKDRDINYGFFLNKDDAMNAIPKIEEIERQDVKLFDCNYFTLKDYGTLNTKAEAARHTEIVNQLLLKHGAIKANNVNSRRKFSIYNGIQKKRQKRKRQQTAHIFDGSKCGSNRQSGQSMHPSLLPLGSAQHKESASLPSPSGQSMHPSLLPLGSAQHKESASLPPSPSEQITTSSPQPKRRCLQPKKRGRPKKNMVLSTISMASLLPSSSELFLPPPFGHNMSSISIPSQHKESAASYKKRCGEEYNGAPDLPPFSTMPSIPTQSDRQRQKLQQLFEQIGHMTGDFDFDQHDSGTIRLEGNLKTKNNTGYIGVYLGGKRKKITWRMRYRDDSGNLNGGYYDFQLQAAIEYDAVKINEIIKKGKKISVLHLNFKPSDDEIEELRKKGIKVIRYIYEHI